MASPHSNIPPTNRIPGISQQIHRSTSGRNVFSWRFTPGSFSADDGLQLAVDHHAKPRHRPRCWWCPQERTIGSGYSSSLILATSLHRWAYSRRSLVIHHPCIELHLEGAATFPAKSQSCERLMSAQDPAASSEIP